MSTSYYRLVSPITSLRLEEGPAHDRLTVFEMGACAGTLTLSSGIGNVIARRFAEHEDDGDCPLRTHYGGRELGCVVTVNDQKIPDDATVIDEYGRLHTVREVKDMQGRGKQP